MNVKTLRREQLDSILPAMAADGLDVLPDEGEWLGIVEGERPVAVARIFEREGHLALDDVWTDPVARTRGLASAVLAAAAALATGPLWLIADEPDIKFYAKRGFELRDDLPEPLARHYAAKDEWPAASDHEHFALVLMPEDLET